jgi:hypothetical protein
MKSGLGRCHAAAGDSLVLLGRTGDCFMSEQTSARSPRSARGVCCTVHETEPSWRSFAWQLDE